MFPIACKTSRRAVLALSTIALASPALAFPDRPIRLVVTSPAGGGPDIAARLLARELSAALGPNVFVDNRVGGNGTIGAMNVAAAAPDGHTLILVAASVLVLNPHLIRGLAYDPERSFTPIAFIGETTVMMAAALRTPFNTLPDVVAAARARHGGLNYAMPGVASMPHLMGEIIGGASGAELIAVPFRGQETASAILGGQVDLMIDSLTAVLPLVRDGKVRAIASGAPTRMPQLPDIPVMAETFAGTEAAGWFAVFGPVGMPEPVLATLNRRIDAIVREPAFQERLAALGLYPVEDNTPAALGTRVMRDLRRYGEVIRARNIQTN
jgi:tripartite-type tricarboxylate transporter receptor subunit TctC